MKALDLPLSLRCEVLAMSVQMHGRGPWQLVKYHTALLVALLTAICLGGSFANLGFVHGWYLWSSGFGSRVS